MLDAISRRISVGPGPKKAIKARQRIAHPVPSQAYHNLLVQHKQPEHGSMAVTQGVDNAGTLLFFDRKLVY